MAKEVAMSSAMCRFATDIALLVFARELLKNL